MAKGPAGRQSGESTHARERNPPDTSVSRTLTALRDKATKEPEHRFRGLSRLLDKQMLKEAFSLLKSKAAPGIDGMVHVSDMSWTRKVNHPSEVLKKGDEVDAIVLDVDAQQQRISLGMKQLATDPWSDIDSFFKIGDVVKGTVTKITSFGAFVELKDGIDGLVHISQISEDRIDKVKDVLKPGQEVTARVVKIDREERRLGLSIKAANYSDAELAAETSAYEALNRSASNDMMNLGDILDEARKKE